MLETLSTALVVAALLILLYLLWPLLKERGTRTLWTERFVVPATFEAPKGRLTAKVEVRCYRVPEHSHAEIFYFANQKDLLKWLDRAVKGSPTCRFCKEDEEE